LDLYLKRTYSGFIADHFKAGEAAMMNYYSPHSLYSVSLVTFDPSPADIRRWSRVLRIKLGRAIQIWSKPFVHGGGFRAC
jgi:hypothetical protein